MADATFQKTNLDWQLQQVGQRFGEWLELQFSKFSGSQVPDPDIPPVVFETLFWVLVVALVTWMLWMLYRILRPYLYLLTPPASTATESRHGTAQPMTVADWLARAQALQAQGNYAQACRALYMAMVQRLDDTQRLPNEPSRTDGEYLRAVQVFPAIRPYQTLIRTHEQLLFGDASAISNETWRQCQQAYREIEAE